MLETFNKCIAPKLSLTLGMKVSLLAHQCIKSIVSTHACIFPQTENRPSYFLVNAA